MHFTIVYSLIATIPSRSANFGDLSRSTRYRSKPNIPMLAPRPINRECFTTTCALKTRKNVNWGLRKLNNPAFPESKLENTGIDENEILIKPSKNNDFLYPEEAGEGVVVYVIDSGFSDGFDDYKYPVRKVDVTGTRKGDTVNHGTIVASIIGGVNNGVSKNVEIVSVKVLKNGSEIDDIIKGLEFVAEDVEKHGKKAVVNMSLGFYYPYFNTDRLRFALKRLVDLGVIIVKAAGNAAENAGARDVVNKMKGVIVVGAIDLDNEVSDFSNYGKDIDLFAPGGNVAIKKYNLGLKYNVGVYGTSFAAPYVAGVAATYLSLGITDVYKELISSAHIGYIKDGLHGSKNRIVNNIPKSYKD